MAAPILSIIMHEPGARRHPAFPRPKPGCMGPGSEAAPSPGFGDDGLRSLGGCPPRPGALLDPPSPSWVPAGSPARGQQL